MDESPISEKIPDEKFICQSFLQRRSRTPTPRGVQCSLLRAV
jgi:hypothetical protein